MAGVRIIGSSKVRLQQGDSPPSSVTTRLSFFDVFWIRHQPVKTVFLYPDAALSPSSFDSFKSSLSLILPKFYPLAGDLTYEPATGEIVSVCSDESGVIVIEAESDLDICRLAGDPTHDIESFLKLVPKIAHEELPVPILSIQFTRFSLGGVAVGISLHHVAMDGRGKLNFLDCWAKTCCHGTVPSGLSLLHDRGVIKYPNMEVLKNEILMRNAPNLPKIDPISKDPFPDHKHLIHRSFTVDTTTIQLLKQRAMQEMGETHNSSPPTTFVVLGAHVWITIAHVMGITIENNMPTFLISLLDGRPFLCPPISTSYTSNCLFPYVVASSGSGMMCANGFGRTCKNIAETIRTTKENAKRADGRAKVRVGFDSLNGLKVVLSGSNRLKFYEVDFGWGKPSLTLHASMNYNGEVVMFAGKEKGTVQLTVKLNYKAIEEFMHAFSEGLTLASSNHKQHMASKPNKQSDYSRLSRKHETHNEHTIPWKHPSHPDFIYHFCSLQKRT